MLYDLGKKYEYENGYMATASPQRFSKFISHLEFFNKTSELRGEIVELGVLKVTPYLDLSNLETC